MNEISYLCRRLDISLEKDKSPRPFDADEFALIGAQFRSGYACDECPRVHAGRLARGWPEGQHGSRKRPLIPLDDALPAGSLQAAAELRGFIGGPERTYHGAVVDAFVAEIGAFDQRRSRSQHRRELALQGPVGGLRVGFVPLR